MARFLQRSAHAGWLLSRWDHSDSSKLERTPSTARTVHVLCACVKETALWQRQAEPQHSSGYH
jgi:hypothetical protein